MGKTKIKTIDDPAKEEKKPAKKLGRQDELVERLKAELGVTEEKTKEIHHPSSKKIRSKKYQEASKDLDRSKTYPVAEAVDMVKKLSFSKFTGTLEAHINTVQTGIRGLVSPEYKTEPKAAVIHLGLGKLDQPTEQLTANITTLLQTLGKSRVKKVSLSPTMGPSVKLDLSSL